MGRGDKKTAKGKRFMGSFGVSRPHKIASTAPKPAAAATATATKATKATKASA